MKIEPNSEKEQLINKVRQLTEEIKSIKSKKQQQDEEHKKQMEEKDEEFKKQLEERDEEYEKQLDEKNEENQKQKAEIQRLMNKLQNQSSTTSTKNDKKMIKRLLYHFYGYSF